MNFIVITSLFIALFVYIAIGFSIGRRTKGIADLLPLARGGQACVQNTAEFTSSTVATTLSLATVIMAFFELVQYLGVWLFWPVITTAAGLFAVRLLAKRIYRKIARYSYRPTLHDFLGTEFNSTLLSRVGAICTSMGFLGAFAVELAVGSKFFAYLVPNVSPWLIIFALSLVAFFYTAFGGFRAVIITDRIQMISIWLLLFFLGLFYMYYATNHGGYSESISRIPPHIFSFSAREGLLAFILGIFAINVPAFISDMSIWQRIAGAREERTVTAGLYGSIFAAAVTWAVLALLACFVFMIVKPSAGINPLVSLLGVIQNTKGLFPVSVLFFTILGLYGAMLSTASTQLIAVSHTLYADVFLKLRKDNINKKLQAKNELMISRLILVVAALISTIIIQFLFSIGFSIADLVFAIYGSQLGLCPLVILALVRDKEHLKNLSTWAAMALLIGFVAGWSSAVYGRISGNTSLVFLAPVSSLIASSLVLFVAIVCNKAKKVITQNVNLILLKSVIKARSRGLYRFVPANDAIRLDCLKDKCAKCCKSIGTPVVAYEEVEKIGTKAIMKDKDSTFIISSNCVCSLLSNGLCSIYPVRPRGCHEYPWYNIKGRLYYDSGCPGVKHDLDERPDVNDIQPFENFFPRTPKFVIWIVKKICVRNSKPQKH